MERQAQAAQAQANLQSARATASAARTRSPMCTPTSTNARCTGSSSPSRASPSIVVTSALTKRGLERLVRVIDDDEIREELRAAGEDDEEIETGEVEQEEIFKTPRKKAAAKVKAAALARMFVENFATYADGVPETVRHAGPTLAVDAAAAAVEVARKPRRRSASRASIAGRCARSSRSTG